MTWGRRFPARHLTVEPGPPAVSPVEEVGHVLRYPLHDGDFIGVQLAVGAQAGRVVDGFGGSRLVQPLLQPFQGDEIVRGTWEGEKGESTKRNKPVRVSHRTTQMVLYNYRDIRRYFQKLTGW